MPVTPLQLARRLRAARKACHITQAKAARVLGIPRSAVSQMETGQRGVSALELHRLAQLYSRDVGGFLEDRFEESNPVAAMFRAHPELRCRRVVVERIIRSGSRAIGRFETTTDSAGADRPYGTVGARALSLPTSSIVPTAASGVRPDVRVCPVSPNTSTSHSYRNCGKS